MLDVALADFDDKGVFCGFESVFLGGAVCGQLGIESGEPFEFVAVVYDWFSDHEVLGFGCLTVFGYQFGVLFVCFGSGKPAFGVFADFQRVDD